MSDDISDKVNHVKSQGQTRDHTCHWPHCNRQVPPAMWGCKEHWYKLPEYFRVKIWAAYRIGQEIKMNPSKEYIAIAVETEKWIHDHYPTT